MEWCGWEVKDGMVWVGDEGWNGMSGRWGDGMAGKGYSTKWWKGMTEAQKSARKGYAGSLMAEMKQNLH